MKMPTIARPSAALYAEATQILHDCKHATADNVWVPMEVSLPGGGRLNVCCPCWNAHVAARRAARKVQLAENAKPCEAGCGRKVTKNLRGVSLCGRCCTRACKTLNDQVQRMGWLALGGVSASRDTILAHARGGAT